MADGFTLKELEEIVKTRTEAVIGAWTDTPTGQTKEIVKQYQTAYKNIDGLLEKAYARLAGIDPEDAGYYNELIKTQRLQKLNEQIKTLYNDAAKKAGLLQVESSTTGLANTYYGNMYSVNWFSGIGGNEYFAVLNPNVVRVSVVSTPKIWEDIRKNHPKTIKDLSKYQPRHGTLIKTLNKNVANDIEDIGNAVTQSLLNGDSYETLTADIKKIMNNTASQARTIARTEGIRNMNAGALANTEEAMNAGVDVGREVVEVVGDGRTREQSLAINGQRQPGIGPFEYPGGLLVNTIGNSGVAAYDINERGSSVDYVEGIEPNTIEGVNPVTGGTGTAGMTQFNKWMKDNDLEFTDTGRIKSKGKTAF